MIAFASSLDQAGPLARSAEDCALLLDAMAGFDERDSTSAERRAGDFAAGLGRPRAGADASRPLAGLRIGLPAEFFPAALDADVEAAVRGALAGFERLGAELVEVSLPRTELSIPVYYIIAPAEASSNLSRFDGVRYGHRADGYADLGDMYRRTRAEGFGAEVKRRIMIGTYVLSHGYYDAYYLQAQKLRRMIADDFRRAFGDCDLIAGPVAPTGGVEARRAPRRPGGRLPRRHLHPAGEPGRAAGDERAGGLRRRRPAGRPAARRQLLRRGDAAARRARLPAGDRLAPACARARRRRALRRAARATARPRGGGRPPAPAGRRARAVSGPGPSRRHPPHRPNPFQPQP